MKPFTLLFVVVLVLAAFTGGVQAQADGGNLTNETANETDTGERLTNETENESTPTPEPTPEPAPTPPEEAESDDENVSTAPPTVSREITPTLRMTGEEWTEDGVYIIFDSDLPSDTAQITERYGDDRYTWETYTLRRGENRIYYPFEVSGQDELAVASVTSRQGRTISPPTAAVWTQAAQWVDHWLTWIATGSGFLAVLVYRFKRRKFWEERRFFSLLDRRVVGEMDAADIVGKNGEKDKPETRSGRFRTWLSIVFERFKRVFYSTRGVLAVVVVVLVAEILTGGALSRFFLNQKTEYQLLLLVFGGSLIGWYWPAGKFLNRVYTPDLRSMLVVDPIDGGEVDVVQGGRERFRNLTINGADSLVHKPTPGGSEILLARSYEAATHSVTATWHKLADEVEQLASNKAIRANTWILANKLDEAREIISSQVALRLAYQDEADKIAQEKLDEVKLPDHRTTSETIAEDVDAWTHRGREDTAAEDVDYVGEEGGEDASNASEAGSEQAANDGSDNNGGEE